MCSRVRIIKAFSLFSNNRRYLLNPWRCQDTLLNVWNQHAVAIFSHDFVRWNLVDDGRILNLWNRNRKPFFQNLTVNKLRSAIVLSDFNLVILLCWIWRIITAIVLKTRLNLSISNNLYSSSPVDAVQPSRYSPLKVITNVIIELANSLFELQPISISVEVVSNWR